MKSTKYSHILDSLTDDQIPQNLDLAPQILNRIQKKGASMNKRMKVLVPITLVLVVIAVTLFTVPALAQTIQRWIGYLPGFGLVEDSNIRKLGEPVQVTQDGVTLTITDVTSSSTKTVIKYNLSNIPSDALLEGHSCKAPDNLPVLELPDGSTPDLQQIGWEYDAGTIFIETTFTGIPADVNSLNLNITCISQTRPGSIPWDWNVPMQFSSSPEAAMSIAPVIEVTPSTTEQTLQPRFEAQPEIDAVVQVVQIIPLENGYILSGNMTVGAVDRLTVDETDGYLEDITILDANNKEVASTLVPDDFSFERFSEPGNAFNWGFMIPKKDIDWPVTITVNSVTAVSDDFAPASFTFDVGTDPQPDQVWTLNQDIPLGDQSVHVVSIRRIQNKYGENGYELSFIYDPALEFTFEIENCDPTGGGGQGGMEAGDTIAMMRSCKNVPVGTLKVVLTGRAVQSLQGPWQISVNKPQ